VKGKRRRRRREKKKTSLRVTERIKIKSGRMVRLNSIEVPVQRQRRKTDERGEKEKKGLADLCERFLKHGSAQKDPHYKMLQQCPATLFAQPKSSRRGKGELGKPKQRRTSETKQT
jgi:hypothetical protein